MKRKIKSTSNVIKILLIILILALVLRIPNLNKTIVFDEYIQTKAASVHNSAGLESGTEIPPLTNWTRIAFTSIFGLSTFNLKLVSVLFGLLSIWIVYLIAKEIYNKKIAIISSILLAISAWHVLVTTSISFDGAFLTFYCLLTMFFFMKYVRTEKSKWLYLTGLGFGLAMLTKYNAILLVPMIIAYYLYENKEILKSKKSKDILKATKVFTIIGLIGFIVFLIFPITAYLTDFTQFTITLTHTNQLKSTGLNLPLLLIQFVLAAFWAGPLFLGLYALSIKYYSKEDFMLHAWIVINLIFCTFIVGENSRPVERYLVILLPFICILGAKAISKIKFERNEKIILLTGFFVWLAILFVLNLSNNQTLPFYPKTEFINHAINFNWNFLVPFTGDQGPIGMYIAFSSIVLSFILCIIFLILYFIKKLDTKFLILFLGVALAFNMFMILEMSYSFTNLNVDLETKEALNYMNDNSQMLPSQAYIFRNYALKYYLSDNFYNLEYFDFDKINSFETTSPSTILVVDFPKIEDDSVFWKKLKSSCNLAFESQNRVGKVFVC